MKLTLLAMSVVLAVSGAAQSGQPSSDDERRAAVTVMRAINTTEAAIKGATGSYAPLADLLNHQAMGRVKAK